VDGSQGVVVSVEHPPGLLENGLSFTEKVLSEPLGRRHASDFGYDLGPVAVVVFVTANSRLTVTCVGLLAGFADRDCVLRCRGLGCCLQFLRRLDCLFGLSLCVCGLERLDPVAHG